MQPIVLWTPVLKPGVWHLEFLEPEVIVFGRDCGDNSNASY